MRTNSHRSWPSRGAPRDGVVVITGASSGVGRATALAFADGGARLVLAARGEQALHDVAAECADRGADVLVVPGDVGVAEDAEHLRQRALERFGAIDVWVEAAAVMIAAPFGAEPLADVRRLVETNVGGAVLGSRAALEVFRDQGHGVLILVSSLLGLVPNPRAALYSMTKFAIRGLGLNLRQAVAGDPGIHVSVVLPGPVDTPIFQRAANYTGRQLRAIPPATGPERVAARIVRCARRPRRQVTVGALAHLVLAAHHLAPRLVEWGVARYSATALLRRAPQEDTSGWLFAPPPGGVQHSRWRKGALRRRLSATAARVRTP